MSVECGACKRGASKDEHWCHPDLGAAEWSTGGGGPAWGVFMFVMGFAIVYILMRAAP